MTEITSTIGLAQIDTQLGNKAANLIKIEHYCHEAAKKGAKLICFPELATTGYRPDLLKEQLWELSETNEGETSQLLSNLSLSLDITIICGFIERGTSTGQIYNSAGIWTPTYKKVYRKVHAFGSEKLWFTGGNNYPIFDTSIGKIGILICYDLGFPEAARALTLQGAELLFVPSAWCIQDQDMWNINIACRALENTVYLAGVNRYGKEQELYLFGGSKIAGPRGQTLVQGSTSKEELLLCKIDFNALANTRLQMPYLRDRRTDTY